MYYSVSFSAVNALKPASKLIALTATAKKDFCQSARKADRIETNRVVLEQDLHNIRYSIADAREIQLEPNHYSAIVAVTLLDHLSEEEGEKVASSLITALKPDGFIYIEVFTIHDPAAKHPEQGAANENISETSCFVKHFFKENELSRWFAELEILSYQETMKYDDSHGTPHYHGVARLIGRKPSTLDHQ